MRSGSERAALPEVALEPRTRVVADLHLDPQDGAGVQRFAAWVEALPPSVPRLVILGDLFEYWVGPAQARDRGAERIMGALAALGRRAAIDFVPGNRDFLLDPWFERRTGARVRPAGFVGLVDAGSGAPERVLLIHGDELCTLDRGYQRLRAVLRSAPVRWIAPRLPASLGRALARRLRRASKRAVAAKPAPEKAQQREAAARLCASHRCSALVCGHAHVFRDERLAEGMRWIVLGAFGSGQGDVLDLDERAGLTARDAP
jgi:UDP-2,3-diacylglucosamine hydrolase